MRIARFTFLTGVLCLAASVASAAGLVDPIPARIAPSGYAVTLSPLATFDDTSGPGTAWQGRALINHLTYPPDDSGRLFVNDSRGPVHVLADGVVAPTAFLDMRELRAGAFDGSHKQGGLRSLAFHPDFARPGMPGFQVFYTLSTETPESASADSVVFEGPFAPVQHTVLTGWRVSAADPDRVDPQSRREVLRIAQPSRDHGADQIVFDPNAAPGTAAYGLLYLTVGDGGNNAADPDPNRLAQNGSSALGKILRIDPLQQSDGASYGVPSDNPFLGASGYLPEVWALGLRHPASLSFDTAGAGACLVTDIGQDKIEEVNLCRSGANYGWRDREGTFATQPTGEGLDPLPANDAGYGFTYPVMQYDDDEGINGTAAITGGNVYRGSAVPGMAGQYIFGDMVTGRMFHAPVTKLKLDTQVPPEELTIVSGDTPTTLLALVGGARADLRIGQGPDGEMYVMTKQDGIIRRVDAYGLWYGTWRAEAKVGSDYGDTFYGRGGDDVLEGRSGPDRLYGQAGDDRLIGGLGPDILSGGPGVDLIEFDVASDTPKQAPDTIWGFRPGEDTLILRGLSDAVEFVGAAPFAGGGHVQVRHDPGKRQVQIDLNGDGALRNGDAVIRGLAAVSADDIVFAGA